MIRLLRVFVIAVAITAMGGCHVQWLREHSLGCHLNQQTMIRDMLYFGSSIPGGGSVDTTRT